MNWLDFPNDGFCVHGLPWFEEDRPALRRLPERLKDTFREPVWQLAQNPAGGRIMFATDSAHVGIRAKAPDFFVMNHITRIGQSGYDCYVDDNFMGSVSPDAEGKIEAEWRIQKEAGKLRNITIHMPLYKSAVLEQIGLDEGSVIKGHAPFALDQPVIYYGTSITQGGCASTPGTTYQNFVSRALNVDFINLGFSGNGLGEPELAQAINEIECCCLVIDHWANKNNGTDYRENLPVFIGELRKVHKTEPIVVMGPFFFTRDAYDDSIHAEQRAAGREYVEQMKKQGDRNIYWFDGRKMIGPETAFGLVDGVHGNSLGFYLMAQAFTPFLKKVLKL
jgi:lysophospholipase L1-like esterase